MRIRRALSNLLLMLFGVALALGTAELSLRLLGFPSRMLEFEPLPDARFSFMKPNQDFIERWYERQGPYRVSINSAGFRDNELRHPGGFKIFVVGDSMTFGSGVEFQDTYVDRLEKKLQSNSSFSAPASTVDRKVLGHSARPAWARTGWEIRLCRQYDWLYERVRLMSLGRTPWPENERSGKASFAYKAALVAAAFMRGPALNDFLRSDGKGGWLRGRPANLPTRRVFFASKWGSVRAVIDSLRWLSRHREAKST